MKLSVQVRNRGLVTAALLALCAATSCDTTTKVINLANFAFVTPDRVTVVASPDPVYKWRATFTIGITEINGVGAKITSTNVAVSQAAAGVAVPGITDETFKFVSTPSAERIEPMGTASIDFVVDYKLPSGDREAVIDVLMVFVDDYPAQISRTREIGAI